MDITEQKSKHLFNWIAGHLNIISLVILIIAIIMSALQFFNYFNISEGRIIITLLLLLAIQFFILNIGYLERFIASASIINEYTKQISKIEYSKSDKIKQMFHQAKYNLFFSGLCMSCFNDDDLVNSLINIDSNVTIDIVITDTTNQEVLNILNFQYGISENEWKARQIIIGKIIKKIKKKRPSTNVSFINIVSPISYFAIDYDEESESSFIQTKYYSIPKDKDGNLPDFFYCGTHPETGLYNYYRKQIFLLKMKANEAMERIIEKESK